MKKLPWDVKIPRIFSVLVFSLIFTFSFLLLDKAYAADPCDYYAQNNANVYSEKLEVEIGNFASGTYQIEAAIPWDLNCRGNIEVDNQSPSTADGIIRHTFWRSRDACYAKIFEAPASRNISVWQIDKDGRRQGPICTSQYTILPACAIKIDNKKISTATDIKVSGSGVPQNARYVLVQGPVPRETPINVDNQGNFSVNIGTLGQKGDFAYTLYITDTSQTVSRGKVSSVPGCEAVVFSVGTTGNPADPPRPQLGPLSDEDVELPADKPTLGPRYCNVETGNPMSPPSPQEPPNPKRGIRTALGCIPVQDTNEFIAWVLGWAIGVVGGIAFLLIVFSSFQIMTASGDPEKLQAGRELLTAAISGLILIIFSVFLLRLIGVEILGIPGLGQ